MELKFDKIELRFSIAELDMLILTLLNNITNKKLYSNVVKFINILDHSSYINDDEKAARVVLIENITSLVISQNLENKQILLNTIDVSGRYSEIQNNVLTNLMDTTISEKESNRIDRKISLQLKLAVVEKKASALTNLMDEIKSESYKDLDDLENKLNLIEEETGLIGQSLKNYREAIEEANNTISLTDTTLLSVFGKIADDKKNPSSKVRTGLQVFNKILDGGYQNGRVYCCLAPLKNWKSGFLLSSALWAVQYNTLKAKDNTKKPVVLYLTLENSNKETIERVMAHYNGNDYKIEEHTPQENFKNLNTCLYNNSAMENDVELVIMYKPNKSVTVQDIKAIMDDYLKNGKEIVFLVIDYLKRIRPPYSNKDLRLTLGDITDELHDLALEKDIPILTAMQLNRNAIAELDSAQSFEQKLSASGRIGGSNVGESIDIIQNVDFAFAMVRMIDSQIDPETQLIDYIDKYLVFKVVATRYKTADIDTFVHRFIDGNDMSLVEDINAKVPASIIGTSALINSKVANKEIKTRNVRHP